MTSRRLLVGLRASSGTLHHHRPARYEGHEFSIGTPYPDRDPRQLAGGALFLGSRTFRSATLTTFDENDYFVFSISTDAVAIVLQGCRLDLSVSTSAAVLEPGRVGRSRKSTPARS